MKARLLSTPVLLAVSVYDATAGYVAYRAYKAWRRRCG